jgi:hypothetical protein
LQIIQMEATFLTATKLCKLGAVRPDARRIQLNMLGACDQQLRRRQRAAQMAEEEGEVAAGYCIGVVGPEEIAEMVAGDRLQVDG